MDISVLFFAHTLWGPGIQSRLEWLRAGVIWWLPHLHVWHLGRLITTWKLVLKGSVWRANFLRQPVASRLVFHDPALVATLYHFCQILLVSIVLRLSRVKGKEILTISWLENVKVILQKSIWNGSVVLPIFRPYNLIDWLNAIFFLISLTILLSVFFLYTICFHEHLGKLPI